MKNQGVIFWKNKKNIQRKKQIKLYVTEEEYKNIILKMKFVLNIIIVLKLFIKKTV